MSTSKAVLTGLLWVESKDLTPKQLQEVKQRYTYPHPYEDTSFSTYIELDGRIGVPFGDKQKVKRLLPELSITDKRVDTPVDKPFKFSLRLRPYQKEVVKGIFKFIHNGGTEFNLAGKPSSGKTITLAAILAKLGVKTLIIANQSMLISQIYEEMSQNTTANVKVLTASDFSLTDINIATSQFISQNKDVWYALKKGVGCVVLDEAHSLASPSTTRIIQKIYAKYSIFISATFTRSVDARTEALTDFAGHKTFTLVNDALIVPKIMMIQCPERYPRYVSKFQAARDKAKFFDQQSIFDKVELLTEASLKKGRQVLIVTDVVNMQEALAESLKAYGVGILNGSTKAAERRDILSRYATGEIKILIGGMVLNAGLSIPRITTIIRVAFPSSGEKNVQIVGRALRTFEGKDGAFIFDLVFQGKSSKEREEAYKANGYAVTHHSWDKIKEKIC